MNVLNGIDQAKKAISNGEMAFVGRLESAKLTMSTRSIPSTNYYRLKFADDLKTLKGTVPATTEFEYQQICRTEDFIQEDGTIGTMYDLKEPRFGQYYVAIYNSDEYTIETLIEINDKDLLTL